MASIQKVYEGKMVEFLGDDCMKSRLGIITDILEKSKKYYAVVMWNSDEYIAIEDGISVICFDSGVANYPLISLQNTKRFKIY